MAQLRQHYDEFLAREAEVIAIGPEAVEEFRAYWEEHQMPFIGLPDPEHRVADLYAQQVRLLRMGRLPALFVIDKDGEIRYAHYGSSMADTVSVETLLNVLDQLDNTAPPTITTQG